MAYQSSKGSLPYGWIVKTSTKYPDRVYYFNINTGNSTWECPELNPPRLTENKDTYSKQVGTLNKSSEDRLFPGTDVLEDKRPKESFHPTAKTSSTVAKGLTNPNENKTHSKMDTRKGLLPLPDGLLPLPDGLLPLPKGLLPLPNKFMRTSVQTNKVPSTSRRSFNEKVISHTPPGNLPNNLFSLQDGKEFILSKQSKDLFVPSTVSRKRKSKSPLLQTPEFPKSVLNPPTAIVTPVVVDKDASVSSLPTNHGEVRTVYGSKMRQLQKNMFSSSAPSTSKAIEVTPKMQSRSGRLKNKSPLCASPTDKNVKVSPKFSPPSSTSPSGSEYDTDLDMTVEPYELSDIQSNSCEDIEMLDVSSDLTKIDDLAVSAQIPVDLCSYYIVIDTNVLIEDLHQIDEIKDTPINGCGPPHIFIPWIVIQELDGLKSFPRTSKTSRAAQQAVRYLNRVLKSKHPRFHGQSPQEAEDCAKTYSECNDDKILECCMSLAQKMPAEKVVLITHDKNLINKALICDILVHSWDSLTKGAKLDVLKGSGGSKKKKRKKSSVEILVKSLDETNQTNKDLLKEQDVCKMEIHSIMSEARQLLKEVLLSFLTEEMNEAYGDPWNAFPINKQHLNGILDAFLKYWRTVFSLQIPEKYKRSIELLKEKTNRPEGFYGDREDCLGTLTIMEDIFCCIKRRWPKLEIPIQKVENLRLRCNDTFTKHNSIDISISQIQSEKDLSDADSVLLAFENAWTVVNHLSGMVCDFYGIPHSLVYEKPGSIPSSENFRRLMGKLHPCVLNIMKLMLGVVAAIKNHNPRRQIFTELYEALNNLVPTLQIQANNPKVPKFSPKSLEKYCRNPENKERVQYGCKQIEHFFSKLDDARRAMASTKSEKLPDGMVLD